MAVGLDPADTVDEFCRLYLHGDRRARSTIREIASITATDSEYQGRDRSRGTASGARAAESREAPGYAGDLQPWHGLRTRCGPVLPSVFAAGSRGRAPRTQLTTIRPTARGHIRPPLWPFALSLYSTLCIVAGMRRPGSDSRTLQHGKRQHHHAAWRRTRGSGKPAPATIPIAATTQIVAADVSPVTRPPD